MKIKEIKIVNFFIQFFFWTIALLTITPVNVNDGIIFYVTIVGVTFGTVALGYKTWMMLNIANRYQFIGFH
ncbi:hypothetical protein HOG21_02675 [bacterium]|jgi:hypothetical protein|nr:hypothetical protein [bacterium]